MDLSTRVQDNLKRIEEFLKDRESFSVLEAKKVVKEIRAETMNIFTVGFHTNKGDIEAAFYNCWDEMISLQYNTMMFLTV